MSIRARKRRRMKRAGRGTLPYIGRARGPWHVRRGMTDILAAGIVAHRQGLYEEVMAAIEGHLRDGASGTAAAAMGLYDWDC